MDRDTPSNTSLETIYVIDSCRETRGRVRGVGAGVQGMAGVLARMQSYKKGESPPPPYDSPPPYHVAITMGNVPDVVMSEPINIWHTLSSLTKHLLSSSQPFQVNISVNSALLYIYSKLLYLEYWKGLHRRNSKLPPLLKSHVWFTTIPCKALCCQEWMWYPCF